MPLIGTLPQIGPSWNLTPGSGGLTLLLGGAPLQFETGGVGLDFIPDGNFSGSVTVLGFGVSKDESDANVFPVAIPFRAYYLNGAISDLSMQISGTAITDRSSILVPASAIQVALLVACSAGSCAIYTQAVVGSTAP